MKSIHMIRAADRQARGALGEQILRGAAGLLSRDAIGRLVVNLVRDPPDDIPYRPAGEVATGDGLPSYDAVIEVWGDGSAARTVSERLQGDLPGVAAWDSFAVEETVEKDEQPHVLGDRSPGMKYIGRLMFHQDLPDSAARRSWGIHVPLALRVHAGASKYVRNWVIDASGEGVPLTRGISELHFRSQDDLIRRFFDGDHGKREVLHDLSHFVAGGSRLYCWEYVLKA